jgi:lysophospholipase L1-like esterase
MIESEEAEMKWRRAGWAGLVAAVAACTVGIASATAMMQTTGRPSAAAETEAPVSPTTGPWTSGWTTAEQYPRPAFNNGSNWSLAGFDNHSVRQVVRMSRGGSELRIQFSNAYGTRPLVVAGATVGRARVGASVVADSVRTLRFGGRTSTRIPVGGAITSDGLPFKTKALESLTVTLYLSDATGPATYHDGALATSYRGKGDQRLDSEGSGFTETSTSWYYLTAVQVKGGTADKETVVTFGDSLTDGYGSGVDTNNRYPDELAELLAGRGTPVGVSNLGINGNKLRVDSPCFGESALSRFRNQVLRQPNATTAVVSVGLNDIGSAGWPTGVCGANPTVTAADIISGLEAMAQLARERGLRIIGATLIPMRGNGYYSPKNEEIRDTVNAWIRSTDAYDAIVDFERVLAVPGDWDTLKAAFDSGDHIHPNDAGRRALAEAVLEVLDEI